MRPRDERERSVLQQSLYMPYKDVLSALGDLANKPVLYVMLVADGGWLADRLRLLPVSKHEGEHQIYSAIQRIDNWVNGGQII